MKDKNKLQAKIQALVIEVLQVLDGQPLLHGLMVLDSAKKILEQEIQNKAPKEQNNA